MCIVIYLTLIALFLYLGDGLMQEYGLVILTERGEWMLIAEGWEMLLALWPVWLALMIAASGVTLFIARQLGRAADKKRLQ